MKSSCTVLKSGGDGRPSSPTQHADGGRPNLTVYSRSGRWVCYRCHARGDVIAFVQQLERLSFREAVGRLGRSFPSKRPTVPARRARPGGRRWRMRSLDPEAAEVLAAAVELYANRLLSDATALAYLGRRGFGRELLELERVGYVVGDELIPYLRWRGLPEAAAYRLGLLRADDREALAGRVVFPEFRRGQPIWLIGRQLEPLGRGPRYLGLPGPKPLLGWDEATRHKRGVCLVEGPMDLLALRLWGIPGLALCGTGFSSGVLDLLGWWQRLYTILDADVAGQEATVRLRRVFGTRVVPVLLPPGMKDPADLASLPGGDALFRTVLRRAVAAGEARSNGTSPGRSADAATDPSR